MSDPNEVVDRANALLREHVIDCLYRLEKLELVYFAREPGERLPQMNDAEEIYAAMDDLKRRLDLVEAIAEQSE